MDLSLSHLNIKDEVDIKEESLDFTEDQFRNEDNEEQLTVNVSNEFQGIVEAENAIFITEEPAEHLPEEEPSFNQFKGFSNLEMFELKEKSMKVRYNLGETNSDQYLNELIGEEKEDSKMKSSNLNAKFLNNEKRFQCEFCSYGTEKKGNLETHLLLHSNLKQFQCSYCGAAFKQMSGLRKHLVVHSDVKPFQCSFCPSTFKRKFELKVHLVVHSDSKPFKCSFCDSSFKLMQQLKKHIVLLHSGLRPFKCSHCGSAFKMMSILKEHLLVHSDVKPFTCPYCRALFKRKNNFNRHVHSCH